MSLCITLILSTWQIEPFWLLRTNRPWFALALATSIPKAVAEQACVDYVKLIPVVIGRPAVARSLSLICHT
jgi:hypothetical protein